MAKCSPSIMITLKQATDGRRVDTVNKKKTKKLCLFLFRLNKEILQSSVGDEFETLSKYNSGHICLHYRRFLLL